MLITSIAIAVGTLTGVTVFLDRAKDNLIRDYFKDEIVDYANALNDSLEDMVGELDCEDLDD